jgi:hypothetical protein
VTLSSSSDGDADDNQESSASSKKKKVRKRAGVQQLSSLRGPHACTQPLPLAPRARTPPLELFEIPNMCVNDPW